MLIFNRRRSFIFLSALIFKLKLHSNQENCLIQQFVEKYTPMVVPAGILELGSSLSSSGHSMTSLLGSLKE